MTMIQAVIGPADSLPEMPEIGLPEDHYTESVRRADRRGDSASRDAYKVGQYITLATNPNLKWDEKLRYFRHALSQHCVPPAWPSEDAWMFYQSLAHLVREYAGLEALRIASAEDDLYAFQLSTGVPRIDIEDHAELFFARLIPSQRPEWLNEEDFAQLRMIRDHWI